MIRLGCSYSLIEMCLLVYMCLIVYFINNIFIILIIGSFRMVMKSLIILQVSRAFVRTVTQRQWVSILICLRYVIFFFIFLTTRFENFNQKLNFVYIIILIVLVKLFNSCDLFSFYVLFEFSLVPISLVIIGWGYQPERVAAFIRMLLYTISASLPLLGIIIFLIHNTYAYTSIWNLIIINNSAILTLLCMLGFLVKFPIFSFHLWLPKAHVEAPVGGSMVLAAILLKMGGFGIWLFLHLFRSFIFLEFLFFFSIWGGAAIRVTCIRQKDIKILIAYSSVAHIRFVIRSLTTMSSIGLRRAFMLIVAHGLASSGLFLGRFFAYKSFYSRNMLLTKSLLRVWPNFSLLWFIICARNMGAPPFINLLAEILSRVVVWRFEKIVFLAVGAILIFRVVYSIILYVSICHGQFTTKLILIYPRSIGLRLGLTFHVLLVLYYLISVSWFF